MSDSPVERFVEAMRFANHAGNVLVQGQLRKAVEAFADLFCEDEPWHDDEVHARCRANLLKRCCL